MIWVLTSYSDLVISSTFTSILSNTCAIDIWLSNSAAGSVYARVYRLRSPCVDWYSQSWFFLQRVKHGRTDESESAGSARHSVQSSDSLANPLNPKLTPRILSTDYNSFIVKKHKPSRVRGQASGSASSLS